MAHVSGRSPCACRRSEEQHDLNSASTLLVSAHTTPCFLLLLQALKVDNLTSLIDERDREVQNIVSSINELAQVGWGECWRGMAGRDGGWTVGTRLSGITSHGVLASTSWRSWVEEAGRCWLAGRVPGCGHMVSEDQLGNHTQFGHCPFCSFTRHSTRHLFCPLIPIPFCPQIMKDLSVLVIDQGTILDRIDYNMEQVGLDQMRQECRRLQPAFCRSLWLVVWDRRRHGCSATALNRSHPNCKLLVSHPPPMLRIWQHEGPSQSLPCSCPHPCPAQTSMKVEEGVRQLEKAEKKQKQSRMVLCIMLLLCAVVVMLLLVVFKAIFL